MLITIEGADGVGKSTLAAALVTALRQAAYDVHAIKFPIYDTPTGQAILQYLAGDPRAVSPWDAFQLYAADRLAARDKLLPFAQSQSVLVVDRYVESNVAHQMARVCAAPTPQVALAADSNALVRKMLHAEYVDHALPRPHLQILLDCDQTTADAAGLHQKGVADHHEADRDYQQRVRAWYRWLQYNNDWPLAYTTFDTTADAQGQRTSPQQLADGLVEFLVTNGAVLAELASTVD